MHYGRAENLSEKPFSCPYGGEENDSEENGMKIS
jgi:hypothetical protein